MSKKLLNKKFLITGGAGFIGSHLAEKLAQNNRVTIFDNFRRDSLKYGMLKQNQNVRLVNGDVLKVRRLRKEIERMDCVIHLAAVAGVSSYYKNPLQTLEVDAWGTYNVLKLASELNVGQVILASSSEVYGPRASNVSEDSLTSQGPATDSRWSYGVGKLVGDHFAFAFAKMTPLKITVVRPFNVYGPRQTGEGAMQIFITRALKGKDLEIRGKGEHIRSWCFIDDFVDGVLKTIDEKKAFNQIFNIGNASEPLNVKKLAKRIIAVSNSKSKMRFVPHPFAQIMTRSPKIDKARELLNWQPKVSLDEGIKKTIEWFRDA